MSNRGQKYRMKSSALLEHVVAVGRKLLTERAGIEEEAATELARDLAHELARQFGGQLFYFPLDLAGTLSRRDRELFARFNGTNHEELARASGLSVQHIYKIVEQVRREEVARRQGRLFALEDPTDQADRAA